MRLSVKSSLVAVATALVLPMAVNAAEIERPATFNPNQIPGIRAAGPNYTISAPVRSDGFLRIYNVRSPYGDFVVVSDAMMRVRIRELAGSPKSTSSPSPTNSIGRSAKRVSRR